MNRADCCQDRLVGARIVVSSTPDYEERGGVGGDPVSCGSVDEAESPIEEQDLIIKVCELGTAGRYVTVVGPNRLYPDVHNLYLSLCEVAVYGECPPLSAEAMGGTLSAAAAAAAESLGANCDITMGTEGPLSFADAERSCKAAGGHLASIHNEQEADYARALIANSPYVAYGEAWIGLNDLHVECRKIAILSRFVALSVSLTPKVSLFQCATATALCGPTARRMTLQRCGDQLSPTTVWVRVVTTVMTWSRGGGLRVVTTTQRCKLPRSA